MVMEGRLLVFRIKQQCYKVHSFRKSVRRVKPVHKKAILYKYILGYSGRVEEVYGGSC